MVHKASISRRRFLKATAAAVSAPLFLPASARGANDRITIAAIGVGNRGRSNLRGILRFPDVRVRVVCDPVATHREVAKTMVDGAYTNDDCQAAIDFRDVVSRPDIDAVMIGTPDHWHAYMTIAAARAGKHIYCQKPLSLTVHEGRAMSDAVRDAGVTFQTGSHQRSYPNFRRTCETGAQRGRWQVAYGAGRTAGRYARLR